MNIFHQKKLQLSRNDPCWCGSGKKYKKCHINSDLSEFLNYDDNDNSGIIIKNEEQLDGIRKSSKLTRNILNMLEDRVREGVTTEQINEWVHNETIANGAYPAPLNYGKGKGPFGKGFPKSVCTSINEVVCHGIPDNRILKNGDIVNIDVTCNLNGYFGDASRMFIIGEVSDSVKSLVYETLKCLELGISIVKPGARTGDIGNIIQKHAENLGFSVVKEFCGHGVGLEFHEAPQILHYGDSGQGEILRPGMVFTIEPMINMGKPESKILSDGWTAVTLDKSLSAQWEHTVHVTNEGVEVMTE